MCTPWGHVICLIQSETKGSGHVIFLDQSVLLCRHLEVFRPPPPPEKYWPMRNEYYEYWPMTITLSRGTLGPQRWEPRRGWWGPRPSRGPQTPGHCCHWRTPGPGPRVQVYRKLVYSTGDWTSGVWWGWWGCPDLLSPLTSTCLLLRGITGLGNMISWLRYPLQVFLSLWAWYIRLSWCLVTILWPVITGQGTIEMGKYYGLIKCIFMLVFTRIWWPFKVNQVLISMIL